MKTLLRLCVAAVLVTTAAACGEMPTASKPEVSPVRRNGVTVGGGFDVAGDSTTVNTVHGDQTTVLNSTCVEQRGGVIIGGGHYIGAPNCE